MTIKPVGTGVRIWREWNSPNDWLHSDIPKSPGVYQLCVFRNGLPVKTAEISYKETWHDETKARIPAVEKKYAGIVYLGKAVCLYDRFWRLVRSWQSAPTRSLHDSRTTYDENHRQAQNLFGPHEVKCRFMQLSTMDWHEIRRSQNAAEKARELESMLPLLWPDSGQGHDAPSAVATFSEEGNMLKEFVKWFGDKPVLNKQDAEDLGPPPTADELEQYWRECENFDDMINEESIREAAYFIWRDRDSPLGDDWADWYKAERDAWEKILRTTP